MSVALTKILSLHEDCPSRFPDDFAIVEWTAATAVGSDGGREHGIGVRCGTVRVTGLHEKRHDRGLTRGPDSATPRCRE